MVEKQGENLQVPGMKREDKILSLLSSHKGKEVLGLGRPEELIPARSSALCAMESPQRAKSQFVCCATLTEAGKQPHTQSKD